MLTHPLETLEKYVNQPSGSSDTADVAKLAHLIADDLKSLGMEVELHQGPQSGPTITASIGRGDRQLMLMGHMDTVFPHQQAQPFLMLEDGFARGSGVCDMKGGLVVMLYAIKNVLPLLDLDHHRIALVINPDEEVGSIDSHSLILETAKASFAALSFEPCGASGRLTCARKGVTMLHLTCQGVSGHAGSAYKDSASAIQALCAYITRLYTLRDDIQDISFNAGIIQGGTGANVVAEYASCDCEFRYFDEALRVPLMDKIREICSEPVVKGVTASVTFGSPHPAIDLTPKSQILLDMAMEIAMAMGTPMYYERTGGAGDIAIAGQAGIGVLDGLGLRGDGVHTTAERADVSNIEQKIAFAARMIESLLN